MKKLLAIVVLGLLLSSNVKSNELIGIKLECNFSNVLFRYIEFKSSEKLHAWTTTKNSKPSKGYEQYYSAGIRFIDVFPTKKKDILNKSFSIDRETLILIQGSLKHNCKKLNVENIQDFLEKQFEKNAESQKQKNKI